MDETARPVRDALPPLTAERGAITASGGLCAPMEVRYDFLGQFSGPLSPAKSLTLRERVASGIRLRIQVQRWRLGRRVGRWIAGTKYLDDEPEEAEW